MPLAEFRRRVGSEMGTSPWITVSQNVIDSFADVTHDHQFIHVDPERASLETPFGGTIAHGFLTLSFLSHMITGAVPEIEGSERSVNYGFDRIRFLLPVPAGAEIRGHFELLDLDQKRDDEVTLSYRASVEIHGQSRPALVADWIVRCYLA